MEGIKHNQDFRETHTMDDKILYYILLGVIAEGQEDSTVTNELERVSTFGTMDDEMLQNIVTKMLEEEGLGDSTVPNDLESLSNGIVELSATTEDVGFQDLLSKQADSVISFEFSPGFYQKAEITSINPSNSLWFLDKARQFWT
jgi:hypothetical protein